MAVAYPIRGSHQDELRVCPLGTVSYRQALVIQADLQAKRQTEQAPDTLLLLEHPPVYTRGRRASDGELSLGEDFYRTRGIEIVPTDRGGKVTYHGPGQLVGYPIMRVTDIGVHLRRIEARSRCAEGIDYTGVWVGERKIASIGVHVSRGVSTHGFAVNVSNDLTPFSWVVACGLPDVTMTSLARELADDSEGAATPSPASAVACEPALDCFRKRIAYAFCQAHDRRQRLVSPQRLGIDTTNPSRLAERVPMNAGQPAPVALGASAEPVPV